MYLLLIDLSPSILPERILIHVHMWAYTDVYLCTIYISDHVNSKTCIVPICFHPINLSKDTIPFIYFCNINSPIFHSFLFAAVMTQCPPQGSSSFHLIQFYLGYNSILTLELELEHPTARNHWPAEGHSWKTLASSLCMSRSCSSRGKLELTSVTDVGASQQASLHICLSLAICHMSSTWSQDAKQCHFC